MNNDKSFIKLNRKITQWEWFQDGNMLKVWIYILTNCNWKEKEWHGITIEKGCFITSQKAIGRVCDLSRQQVRSILSKLETTQEISIKTTKHLTKGYTLIKVNNWGFYQSDEEENNQSFNHKITNEQPMNNQTITITKKVKKEKKAKKGKNNIYNQEFLNEFEILWKMYPNKIGKEKAKQYYCESRNEYTYEEIKQGLERYIFYLKENNKEQQYIKHGSTWFHNKCWNDECVVYKNDSINKNIVTTERIMDLEIYDN